MRLPWRPNPLPDRRAQAEHAARESLAQLGHARAQTERMRKVAEALVREGAENHFTERVEQQVYGRRRPA